MQIIFDQSFSKSLTKINDKAPFSLTTLFTSSFSIYLHSSQTIERARIFKTNSPGANQGYSTFSHHSPLTIHPSPNYFAFPNSPLALMVTSSLSIALGACGARPKSVRLMVPVNLKPASSFLLIGLVMVPR